MRPTSRLTACVVLALVPLGCGEQRPTLTPVRGTVYFRGAPLHGGTIVFTPDAERGGHGPLACARIGPDGAYTLKTGSEDGAVPGWHRVTIKALPPAEGAPAPPPDAVLPARYSDPELSGQSREVKGDAPNVFDLHLD